MSQNKDQQSEATILHEGKFIRFIYKNGWEYIQRSNCTGIVIIIAISDEGNVIFVEQFRPPVNKKVIEFPAGLVNDIEGKKEESLEAAAKRELYEETGYKAESIEPLLTGPVSAGSTSDLVTLVRAHGIKKSGDGGGDHSEEIITHEVPFAQAEDWLKQKESEGNLIEPKIFSGLYFLKKEH